MIACMIVLIAFVIVTSIVMIIDLTKLYNQAKEQTREYNELKKRL